MEKWLSLEKYPNYIISNYGIIKNIKTNMILRLISLKDGYELVSMSNNGCSERFRVSRLIAKLFIPNPENKPEVNHIDNNIKNNNYKNLEWVTREENMQHAWLYGNVKKVTEKRRKAVSKLTFEQAEEIRKLYIPHKCGEKFLLRQCCESS